MQLPPSSRHGGRRRDPPGPGVVGHGDLDECGQRLLGGASNWSPAGVPSGGDDVVISADSAPYSVSVISPFDPVASLNMSAANARLNVHSGIHTLGSLTATNGEIKVVSGSLQADGGIVISGNARLISSFATLSGDITNSGRIELEATFTTGTNFNNSGTVVIGDGTFGLLRISHLAFNNSGTVLVTGYGGDINGMTNLPAAPCASTLVPALPPWG